MPSKLKRKVTLLISISCFSFQIGALNSKEQRWVDTVTSVYGERAGQRVKTWRENLDSLQVQSNKKKLSGVNNFLTNSILSMTSICGAKRLLGNTTRVYRQ